MTQENAQTSSTIEKFHNAEQLWFWFLYSKSVQSTGFFHGRNHATRRPCELLDMETLITKLYLAGELSDEQLSVMKQFGDKRRAPHQYIWGENRAAQLWGRAMATIETAAKARGWIH